MRPSANTAIFILLASLAWAGCETAATDSIPATDVIESTEDAGSDAAGGGSWWSDVAADATAPDTLADDPDDKPGDKPDDKPATGDAAMVYSGQVDLNTLTGTMTTSLTAGEATVGDGDSLCTPYALYLLVDAGIGHGEDGTLYMDFGKGEEGLQPLDGGSSETDEATWTFSFSFLIGNGGDKGGDGGDKDGDGGDKEGDDGDKGDDTE